VIIGIIIISMIWVIIIKLPASKKYLDDVIKSREIIIGNILHGEEKDSDNILKRWEGKIKKKGW
jgi:hypothetical protein